MTIKTIFTASILTALLIGCGGEEATPLPNPTNPFPTSPSSPSYPSQPDPGSSCNATNCGGICNGNVCQPDPNANTQPPNNQNPDNQNPDNQNPDNQNPPPNNNQNPPPNNNQNPPPNNNQNPPPNNQGPGLDPNTQFSVQLAGVVINWKGDAMCQVGFVDACDPYVKLNTANQEKDSSIKKDVLPWKDASWNNEPILNATVSELKSSLRVRLYDDDFGPDMKIADCAVQITDEDLKKGTVTFDCQNITWITTATITLTLSQQ